MLPVMEWPDVVLPVIVVAAIVMLAARTGRADSILEKWADRTGCRILSSERRALRRGPFLFATGRGQVVYRVTVQDAVGNVRQGYVRCGSYVWSNHADVLWDAEPTYRPGFPVVMKQSNQND